MARHRLERPGLLDRWDPALYAAATVTETAVGTLAALAGLALLVGSAMTALGPLAALLVGLATATAAVVPIPVTTRRFPR